MRTTKSQLESRLERTGFLKFNCCSRRCCALNVLATVAFSWDLSRPVFHFSVSVFIGQNFDGKLFKSAQDVAKSDFHRHYSGFWSPRQRVPASFGVVFGRVPRTLVCEAEVHSYGGLHGHWLTVYRIGFIAPPPHCIHGCDRQRPGGPLATFICVTAPSALTTASSNTVPCTPACRASWGYSDATSCVIRRCIASAGTFNCGFATTVSTAIQISSATVTGAGFAMNGLSVPITLNAGQSIAFNVTFTPSSAGAASGSLALTANGSVTSLSVALSGTGATPGQLTVTPASVTFGNVTVGTTQNQSATLTAGGAGVTVTSATTTNPELSLTGLSLPLTLAAGQSAPLYADVHSYSQRRRIRNHHVCQQCH